MDANYDGTIDDSDENVETSQGGLMALNDDDDNRNGTADRYESPVQNEKNLCPVAITLAPASIALSATAGGNRIQVWSTPAKSGTLLRCRTHGRLEASPSSSMSRASRSAPICAISASNSALQKTAPPSLTRSSWASSKSNLNAVQTRPMALMTAHSRIQLPLHRTTLLRNTHGSAYRTGMDKPRLTQR